MSYQTNPVGWLRWVLISSILVIGTVALPASDDCRVPGFSCTSCTTPGYHPQRCETCCPRNTRGTPSDEGSLSTRLAALGSTVSQLRVISIVLLVLVLLLVLAVLVLFLYISGKLPMKFELPTSYKWKKDSSANNVKTPHKASNGVSSSAPVSSRLANHQSNASPQAKRPSVSRSTLGSTDIKPQPFRQRQPSESTCPEEGSEIIRDGYDNLALSTSTIDTSTLHNTSNSSTDTLGPALSTNTLQTTLASDPHLASNTHNNTRV